MQFIEERFRGSQKKKEITTIRWRWLFFFFFFSKIKVSVGTRGYSIVTTNQGTQCSHNPKKWYFIFIIPIALFLFFFLFSLPTPISKFLKFLVIIVTLHNQQLKGPFCPLREALTRLFLSTQTKTNVEINWKKKIIINKK